VLPEPAKWTSKAYESLTAAGIVEKLPHISQRELGEVETHEKAHQSRLTELQRIGSLHGQHPWSAMTSSTCRRFKSCWPSATTSISARVRGYERPAQEP
jgi:hypothetical protein